MRQFLPMFLCFVFFFFHIFLTISCILLRSIFFVFVTSLAGLANSSSWLCFFFFVCDVSCYLHCWPSIEPKNINRLVVLPLLLALNNNNNNNSRWNCLSVTHTHSQDIQLRQFTLQNFAFEVWVNSDQKRWHCRNCTSCHTTFEHQMLQIWRRCHF